MKIQTPMLLLLTGDHDVIYDLERAVHRATSLVSGLRAEIIPNANRNAQVSAPDLVNEKILEFLASSQRWRKMRTHKKRFVLSILLLLAFLSACSESAAQATQKPTIQLEPCRLGNIPAQCG